MAGTYGDDEEQEEEVSGRTVVCACVAGTAVGGPLFGMMGFSMLASATLVLISSPPMVIFSPVLFCAGLILMAANRDSYWLVYVRLDFSATQIKKKKANCVWCG